MIHLPHYNHEYRKAYREDSSGDLKHRIIINIGGRLLHIAAKKMKAGEDLNLLAKKYLYEKIAFGNEVYLVNKASLLKRLNISKKVYDKATIQNKQDLIAQKFHEILGAPDEAQPSRQLEESSADFNSNSSSDMSDDYLSPTDGYWKDWDWDHSKKKLNFEDEKENDDGNKTRRK